MSTALDAWEQSLRSSDLSPRTVESYLYAAEKLIAHVGPDRGVEMISATDLEGMFANLKSAGLAPGTRMASGGRCARSGAGRLRGSSWPATR